jgi:predicted porin
MKKSLLAVAAMTAFAGAAQAQSSVTVYGILDVGYVGSSTNGTTTTPATNNVNNVTAYGSPTQKQTTNGFGQSAESTSRLGLKGSEDLGGGLSAIFTIETAVNPDGAANAFAFNRQTFAGVKKNGLGETTIGTQYTPLFDVQSATDAAGNNNLVGNAVYSGNVQANTGTYNMGLSPYSGANVANVNIATTLAGQNLNATTGAYTTRVSNALRLVSERFSGVKVGVMYAVANQNQTETGVAYSGSASGTGGVNNNTLLGLSADYIWNKLNVVAAFQSIKNQDMSGVTANTAANSTLAGGTAVSFGTNMIDNQTYAAATYDFGILKAYGQYITRRATSVLDASQSTSRTAYQVGVKSQLTPVISAYATMGLGKSSYYGANLGYNNFRTFQIGSDYYLSKRTNLYVAYGSANQSSAGGTTVVPSNQGVSAANYAMGVRHTF